MTARVRVVVVDFNGGELTLDCLRSLVATDWPAEALEIVLVDNASAEPVTDAVAEEFPSVRVIRAPSNRGFGAGCNLAMQGIDHIDYVALINNDVVVPPQWLTPLVDAFETGTKIGAACPKILLRDRYREVRVDAPVTTTRLDPRSRGVRILGLRAGSQDLWSRVRFRSGSWGPEYHRNHPVSHWTGNGAPAMLLVPDVAGPAEVLLAADRPVRAVVTAGEQCTSVLVTRDPTWHAVPDGGEASEILHNVGTTLEPGGYGADRGYLEVDLGQYDEPTDVFAWCGAAVLLSADYLRDVGLFDERLFLYYEDIDLSWRGLAHGWKYRTVPRSVVRHVHSASTSRNSAQTSMLNERNRLLVLARHGSRGATARSLWRFGLVTASYARRDLVAPVLRGSSPNAQTVSLRLRALSGFLRNVRAFTRSECGTMPAQVGQT